MCGCVDVDIEMLFPRRAKPTSVMDVNILSACPTNLDNH